MQRALVERFGLGISPSALVKEGKAVEHRNDFRVLGAKSLLLDMQRALVERFGLGVATGGLVDTGEVVEALGKRRSNLGTDGPLGDSDSALEKRLGLSMLVASG